MSTARAEKRRAQRDLTEMILQAHNALHDDDVDKAHDFLHAAMGQGPIPKGTAAPLANTTGFDQDFRQLCIRNGVVASYVMAEDVGNDRARICAGGDATLCAIVRDALEKE